MKSQRDAFFDALYEKAINDKRIIVLTADCGAPALDRWQENIPDQFINVGIAEQNMVAVAMGLALSGKRPYCYAIIPFLTGRAYDQIRIACMMNLPIVFVGLGAGYSYDDSGPTHHGIDDIGLMRMLPNMEIISIPAWGWAELHATIVDNPRYIRLDREEVTREVQRFTPHIIVNGKSFTPNWIKPLGWMPWDIKNGDTVEVIEEHLIGGLGSIIAEYIAEKELKVKFERRYIKDYSYAYGREKLRKLNEL